MAEQDSIRHSGIHGDASWMIATAVAGGLGNYAWSFLLAWNLSPRDFSVYSTGATLLLIVGTFAGAAIPWVVAEQVAGADSDGARHAVRFAVRACTMLGIPVAVIVAAISFRTGSAAALILGIAALSVTFATAANGYLQGRHRFRRVAVNRMLELGVRVSVGTGLLAAGAGALAAFSGLAVSEAAVIAAVACVVIGAGDAGRPIRKRQGGYRALWSRAVGLLLVQGSVALIAGMDIIVAALSTGPSAALGRYQAALLIGRVPLFLAGALSVALYPRLTAPGADLVALGRTGTTALLRVTLVGAVVTATVPSGLLTLVLPAAFRSIEMFLPVVAVGGMALGWLNLLTTYFQAAGQIRSIVGRLGGCIAVTAVGAASGLHLAGVYGLACGAACGAVTSALVLTVMTARRWPGLLPPVVPHVIAALAGAAVLAAAARTPAAWAVCVAVGGTAVAILSVLPMIRTRRPRSGPQLEPEPVTTPPAAATVPAHPTGGSGNGPRVLILGGSCSAGLGVHGRSFGVIAAETLGASAVLQLAESARTMSQTAQLSDQIAEFGPDVVLVCAGLSEGLVFPSRFAQQMVERFAPSTWHGVAGLDARPYFSTTSVARRTRQKVTSEVKVAVKGGLILLTGGYHRLSDEAFETALRSVLELPALAAATIVLIEPWDVSARLSPRTNMTLVGMRAAIRRAAAGHPKTVVVETTTQLHYWSDFLADHLHPNEAGHGRLARLAVSAVRNHTSGPS